jgi:hypothetical protein
MLIIPIIPTNFDVICSLYGPCVPISNTPAYLVMESGKDARIINLRELLELRETRKVIERVRKYYFVT